MKKKIILIALILCGVCSAYSQDLVKEFQRLTLENDSLQKVLKTEKDICMQISNNITTLMDTIKTLRADLSELEELKADKKTCDAQLKQKSDSIVSLNLIISEKNSQIRSYKKFDKDKAEVVRTYEKSFDYLIKTSTKESVQRDLQLVGNDAKVAPVLRDLEKYFSAQELLKKKFDAAQIKNAQAELNAIKEKSELLDKLKDNLEYYQDYSNALKETIGKILVLDERVALDDAATQKFNYIVAELSNYMYNYYDYGNYPYLSDIVLEILKRKRQDVNANITDLLNKL